MRYNTGNPVGSDGSSSPFDLHDNAGVLDLLLNGPLGEYLNRLGVPLRSWVGIMQQVTDYLIDQGYESVYLTYGAGVVVQRQTQLVQRSGELYRVMNATDIPLTLTGIWESDAPKLQAVGDAALRQALASQSGSTMIGWQSGSAGSAHRQLSDKLSGFIDVKDFGAKGDGATDDTAAFLAAIASGHSQLYLPPGTYLVNGSLLVSKRVFSVYGAGVSSTIMVFNPPSSAVLWDYIKDTTNKDVFTLRDMTIVTETAGIATPVRINGEIRADALQVNGANDASVIENVSVLSNTGYWQRGLHIRNTGGNHTTNFRVENNTIAQSTAGNSGILIETTDSRVALIRAIHATDTYVLRAHRSVEVRSFSAARPIESVYFNGGELVGCDTGLYGSGAISAMDISAMHFDVINRCVDMALCLTSVARFTSCDFRKGGNGGAMSNGYMIAHDFGELVTYSGCAFSGINHLSPSALNGAFLFTNALTGTGLNRSTIAGCAFRNLNHAYSTTPSLSSLSTAANTYAVIAATVHLDSPSDNSITKQESIVVDSFMQALGTSGDERVSRAIPGEIFYPSAYPIVLVNIETDTGTDNVKIEYMFSESSGTNMVFRVRGNTTARSVRIGFAAMPASYILGI